MSIPEQPSGGTTPVQAEITALQECIIALQRVEHDKAVLGRVMSYLNSRFRVPAQRPAAPR